MTNEPSFEIDRLRNEVERLTAERDAARARLATLREVWASVRGHSIDAGSRRMDAAFDASTDPAATGTRLLAEAEERGYQRGLLRGVEGAK